jgi:hypothetical protein
MGVSSLYPTLTQAKPHRYIKYLAFIHRINFGVIFRSKDMKLTVKNMVSRGLLIALATPMFISASYAAQPAAELATAAKSALTATMGADAKDIDITINNGVATLTGLAANPAVVDRARAIVSRVPGVVNAHSPAVHTWNATS